MDPNALKISKLGISRARGNLVPRESLLSRRGSEPSVRQDPSTEPEPGEYAAVEEQFDDDNASQESDVDSESSECWETLRDYSSFIENISQFFNQHALSDVILRVGDNIYPAHKFVLAKSSDVFRTLLFDTADHHGNMEIQLDEPEACQNVFDSFLRYLYAAEVTICTESAVGILRLADKYNVASLKALSTKYMVQHSKSPNIENALQWYPWSKSLRLPALYEHCFECICWNMYDIMNSDGWLNTGADFIHDILQSSKLVIPDEFTLFENVLNWLLHPNRQSKLYENATTLLPLIRFPQMMVSQLSKIEHHDIARDECVGELIKDLISNAYRFRALCPSQHELGLSFRDDFFQPRDYCYQIVDTVRMANSLRFGIQVDVKMFVGPVPKEERNGDWKITYRKNGDSWGLQVYCHESAMVQNEARFQATVLVSNEDEKVIQVHRANEFICSRGNHQNVQVAVADPLNARLLQIIVKPVAK